MNFLFFTCDNNNKHNILRCHKLKSDIMAYVQFFILKEAISTLMTSRSCSYTTDFYVFNSTNLLQQQMLYSTYNYSIVTAE